MNITLPVVQTPSRIEKKLACYRKGFIDNVLGYQRREYDASYTAFGTIIHECAAVWWRTKSGEAVRQHIHRAWEQYSAPIQNVKLTEGLVESMMEAYIMQASLTGAHWASEEQGWEIVTVEERVHISLWPEADLTFQLDRLLHHPEHDLWVLVDTKSKGKWSPRFEAQWREKWVVSPQQKLYHRAVEQYYDMTLDAHFVEGITRANPSEVTYVRMPAWSASELAEMWEWITRLAQEDAQHVAECMTVDGTVDMDRLLLTAVKDTRFNPEHCFAYNSVCPHFELCTSPVEERTLLLKGEYVEGEQDFFE